ncbi:eCIS core domain-containing protein [Grimontia marina]|uniref:eCIS core domain-containing protein n=1 Tax=Grimontia marina TaxID=646534 RepID=A0A128FIC0_9GAMM|nr:DUF4157 domain-containing protein [Grimontia marina]CZF86016.1 hypothetical protein GMA8713_04049 [Grimontia marina]
MFTLQQRANAPNSAHDGSNKFSHLPSVSRTIPTARRLQTKLTIGDSHDAFEQEADRMADNVVRSSAFSSGGSCPKCQRAAGISPLLLRKGSGNATSNGNVPDIVHRTLSRSGQPLDSQTRAYMEARFGADFSQVRIHTDGEAAASAKRIQARAYTVGHQVVFGEGQYRPDSASGKRLMAHELTHVIQQMGSNAHVIQRAETDTATNCAGLTDCETDVDTKVNSSLRSARAVSGRPLSAAVVVRELASDIAVDQAPGRTAIELWADTLPASKQAPPAQGATKYKGVSFGIWSNPLFPILNPTMKVHGICIGSDKLGHFFQQGLTYFQTETARSTADAEEQSERTEGGGFGLETTGVYSNADQEANRKGGQFYKDLVANPAMTFAISNYINSNWNEESNPNFYEQSVGEQVWSNLLTGSWSGTSTSLLHFFLSPMALYLWTLARQVGAG